ncbi:MAG TPA: DUF433 domain-containing protein [Bryobacteraceae bacterium]|jgi:uncharacterized protein (DUF433 family)
MNNEYVEQRDGGYYLTGVRISLDSIVCSFRQGTSREAILEDFPALRLSQIYGAIAFYLDHKSEIDQYLADTTRDFESLGVPLAEADPGLWQRIERVQAKSGESRH